MSVFASVALSPGWLAALLLLGRANGERLGLPCPSVDAIVRATGASKSHAYERCAELAALLPSLGRAPGRPAKAAAAPSSDGGDLSRAVLGYVMSHPGCVDRGAQRQRYSTAFRRFMLGLRATHCSMDLERFASAVCVPLGTLKDWLRDPLRDCGESTEPEAAASARSELESLQIQTVLDAWTRWQGSFCDFCEHVRRDLRVPFGRDLVSRILATERRRTAARRSGRSPDEIALRGAFRTYFPGAQWIGDGMQVPVVVDGKRFTFNVELHVDGYSDAFVGCAVGDTEDSRAVVQAFDGGVQTTGAAPLALLLDNKPSNHTTEVDQALGDTIRIRATLQRPQNKAHVEGAFGLFSQILPPLVLDTGASAHDVARQFVSLVVAVWARTTNHRPRRGCQGRSRIDLYGDAPDDAKLEQARRELRELAERQQQARRTREARSRPEVLALLDDYFARLELLDPERHIRVAIARYPKDAIVDGLLVFVAKRRANSLPDGADARYLLGIVKNIAAKTEGEILAETLYRGRMEIRDFFLARLRAEREALRSEPDVLRVLSLCAEKAMETSSNLDRTFWLDAIVETLHAQPEAERERLYRHSTHLLEASFDVPVRERHDAARYIADRLVPIR